MVKHTKGFKGLSKKVLSAILAASMIMTSSSFVMAAEPTEEPVPVESTANDVETTEVETEVEETEEATNEVATFAAPEAAETGKAVDEDFKWDDEDVQVLDVPSVEYNGEARTPEVTVQNVGASSGVAYKMEEGKHYTLSYSNNKDVTDDAEVTVNFIGDYANLDSITKKFSVTPLDISRATVKYNTVETAFVYDGQEHYPEIDSVSVVTKGNDGKDKTITLDESDYEVVPGSGDLVNAGTKTFAVEAKDGGNFTGETARYKYSIEKTSLSADVVSVSMGAIEYNNSANAVAKEIKSRISITDLLADEELAADTFTIEYQNENGEWSHKPLVDVGVHTLRVKATDATKNFKNDGKFVEGTYEITLEGSLQNEVDKNFNQVNGTSKARWNSTKKCFEGTYNGKDKFITGTDFKIGNLKEGIDYEVVTPEAEWINAGEYSIELVGLNKYEGQNVSIAVKIAPKYLGTNVSASQGKHPSGNEGAVVVEAYDGKVLLTEGVDYTFEVKGTEDDKEVEVTGIGNYTTVKDDSKVVTVDVKQSEKLPLNDPSITVEMNKEFDYTGDPIEVNEKDITVTENDNGKIITLSPDSDYYISTDPDSKAAGTATLVITGKGKYEGDRNVTIKINGVSFADTFTVAALDDVEKGTNARDISKAVKVTYKSTGATYSNYNVEIWNGDEKVGTTDVLDEVGTYTVKIVPKDARFEGVLETTFNVIGDDLQDLDAKISAIDDQVYTGEAVEPSVTVKIGDKVLKADEDYTVAYSNNVNVGSADVVVTGINEYSGTLSTTFAITKGQQTIEMTNPLQVRDLSNGTRATNSKNCTLKLGFGLEDKVNLSYSSDNEDVATVSNGVITYQGVGECTITVTAKETDNCLEATLPIKVVVGEVGIPTFTPSVTAKTAKKSITVTSSTVRGADGFEVQYSVRSDWWRASTVDFDGTTNGKLYRQTIKTYHSNKKYYIRVRAYQVVDGVKQYSDWSPAKTATTK